MSGCKYGGIEYSEGSIICARGRKLKCRGDEWQDVGDCEQGTSLFDFDDVPIDESAGPASNPQAQKGLVPLFEYRMYARSNSIVRRGNTLRFVGGGTPGGLCSSTDVSDVSVLLENVTYRGDKIRCQSNVTIYYEEIRFVLR